MACSEKYHALLTTVQLLFSFNRSFLNRTLQLRNNALIKHLLIKCYFNQVYAAFLFTGRMDVNEEYPLMLTLVFMYFMYCKYFGLNLFRIVTTL